MRVLSIKTTIAPSSLAAQSNHQQQYSTWHSPIPYLFGGLAAMLGLIAVALLILACSYWRISGGGDGQNEEDEKQRNPNEKPINRECEEKVLVIMAGDDTPTFLAMPAINKGLGLFDGGESMVPENVGVEKLGNEEKVAENGEESEGSGSENS